MTDYQKGFEHAVRNIVAALARQAASETNSKRGLALLVAIDIAKSYHGFMAEENKL